MKRIDTTQETATSWSPFKVESKAFMQDANKEMFAVIAKNLIESAGYTVYGTPYLLEKSQAYNQAVYYNGEIYMTNVVNVNVGFYAIIDTTPNAVADPTIFSDASTHNIHQNRTLTQTTTAAGSLFAWSTLVDLTVLVTTPTLLNSWGINASKTPKHTQIGKKVLFEGAVLKVGGNTGVIFNLPVNARPSIERVVICSSISLAVSYFNNLIIATNGDVSLYDQTGGVGASGYVINLDGISFNL